MHSLHYVVVKAESHEAAELAVNSVLQEFGNEDNWSHISGSICEDGKVTVSDDECARFKPDATSDTLAKLNARCQKLVRNPYVVSEMDYADLFKKWCGRLAKGKRLSSSDDYRAMISVIELLIVDLTTANPFNILTDSFNDECYDEFGVTNLLHLGPWSADFDGFDDEDERQIYKTYVVFVDMHT